MMRGRKVIFGFVFLGFILGAFLTPFSTQISTLSTGEKTVSLSKNTAYAGVITATLNEDGSIDCPVTGIFCGIVHLLVTIQTFISTLVAVLSGLVLDFLIEFSLSSANYGRNVNSFIDQGWKVVRDAANIFFIFGLLLAAFYLILQPKTDYVGVGNDPKRIVTWVIIMALLVNFSLLFTKAIIDVGNITGRVFLDRITEWGDEATLGAGSNESATGNWITDGVVDIFGLDKNPGVSIGILNASNPQKLLLDNSDFLSTKEGWDLIVMYLFVSLMVFVFNLGLIFIFIVVGFLFAARTFGLWLAMILSPLAFVLKAVPIPLLKTFSFDEWFKKTLQLSLMAPVFMFFVYLAILFLGSQNLVFGSQGTFFGNMIGIAIKLIASMFIILQGKKIAVEMSGEVGKAISGLANTLAGVAVGGAIGGTAFLARQTIGRAGARIAASDTLRDLGTGNVGAARDRLASKFGQGRGAWIGDKIRTYGRGGWIDKTAGSWAGRQLARKTIAGGRAIDEQSFDVREYGLKGFGKENDFGNKLQNDKGYTANEVENMEKRKKEIEDLMNTMESSASGSAQEELNNKQRDVENAEKAAKDRSNPDVDAVESAQQHLEDQEKELKNPANAAADAVMKAEQAQKEYFDQTQATFDEFKKDLDARTKGKNKNQKRRIIAEYEAANPEFREMRIKRDWFKSRTEAKKRAPGYLALKQNVADARRDHFNATQSTGYKNLKKAIKDAEKAYKDAEKGFNETQAKRADALQKEYQKLIDETGNISNSAFTPEDTTVLGRGGRTYEGFSRGSTAGVRGGVQSLRDRAKTWRDKNK